METEAFANIRRAVLAKPWAIDPASVQWAAIVDVLALRAAGMTLSLEEIEARVQAAANGPRNGRMQQVGVATIPVYGVISPRQNLMARSSGGTSADSIREDFRAAMRSPEVDGIVFDIDSPGGVVEGIEELAAEIRGARGEKPIAAVANHMAASAAYWLATAADEIVASPSSQVGSIGVFTAHDDLTEAQAKLGVKRAVISAGKYKAEGALGQALSEEARAYTQSQVDAYYSMMVSAIAKGRNIGVDTVRTEYGEGRTLLAKPALAAGMVDRIDTLDNTVRRMARAIARGGSVAAIEEPDVTETDEGGEEPESASAVKDWRPKARVALELAQAEYDFDLAAVGDK